MSDSKQPQPVAESGPELERESKGKFGGTVEENSAPQHGIAKVISVDGPIDGASAHQNPLPNPDAVDKVDNNKTEWFAYFKTRNCWIILCLSPMLSLCDTGTNIFSEYLAGEGTSIPAFQNALTYILVGLCTLLIQCVDDQGLPTVTLKAKLDYCVIDLRTAAN